MIDVKEIKNEGELDSFLQLESDILHIVKLSTPYCGPCKMLAQTIRGLDAEKIKGSLFCEVDLDNDDNEDIGLRYNVRSVPLLVFIKNGEIVKRNTGNISANDIYNLINEFS